jgi:para-aminobenzoate synthetase component 1
VKPKIFDLEEARFSRKDLLLLAEHFADLKGTCFLFSACDLPARTRSFLTIHPFETISIYEKHLVHEKLGETLSQSPCEDPWLELKRRLQLNGECREFPQWLGYLSYEMGATSDPDVQIETFPSKIPNALFQKSALSLSVDHHTGKGQLLVYDPESLGFSTETCKELQSLTQDSEWLRLMRTVPRKRKTGHSLNIERPGIGRNEYCQKVERIKDLIREGDVYQVNLSQSFLWKGRCDPFLVFSDLSSLNPSPFAAYYNGGTFQVISSSPERLLKSTAGVLETSPIKGTAARGRSPEEDEALKEELLSSEKDCAELLMITDLMRNDLGSVSLKGSVTVPVLRRCEAYQNVFHLVSLIRSQAKPSLSPLDILRKCFPGGSITGCPKLRSMQRIAEIEQRPRGLYTGSIGYFAGNGDLDFNIAIRTAVYTEESLEIQVGGAVVIDSDPNKEFEETLHKAASFFSVLKMNPLLEKLMERNEHATIST